MALTRARIGQPMIRGQAPRSPTSNCSTANTTPGNLFRPGVNIPTDPGGEDYPPGNRAVAFDPVFTTLSINRVVENRRAIGVVDVNNNVLNNDPHDGGQFGYPWVAQRTNTWRLTATGAEMPVEYSWIGLANEHFLLADRLACSTSATSSLSGLYAPYSARVSAGAVLTASFDWYYTLTNTSTAFATDYSYTWFAWVEELSTTEDITTNGTYTVSSAGATVNMATLSTSTNTGTINISVASALGSSYLFLVIGHEAYSQRGTHGTTPRYEISNISVELF